jgi:hypothetical protein
MHDIPSPGRDEFETVAAGLHHGDFSRLDPLFAEPPTPSSVLGGWLASGRFRDDPGALNEALTCACFNGRTPWVAHLLNAGADLSAGIESGLNGFHWAANRGQLDVVLLLLERRHSLEVRNCYGGTVLGSAVWAAVHEPRPAHPAIIDALLRGGARVEEAAYPSGDPAIDTILEQYGARA